MTFTYKCNYGFLHFLMEVDIHSGAKGKEVSTVTNPDIKILNVNRITCDHLSKELYVFELCRFLDEDNLK